MIKKAQFKIQEMSFMMLAVVLFLIMAGLFFLAVYYRNLQKLATNQDEENAVLTSQQLAYYPEFSCGSLCIDSDRLIAMQDRKAYENFWPVESIEIRKVYPSGAKVDCSRTNYPDCNSFSVFNKGGNLRKVSSFVSLCRKEKVNDMAYTRCELAKITIGYEVKSQK